MPSLFPTYNAHPDDPNRRVQQWSPGDPPPRVVQVGRWMLVIVAAFIAFNGLIMTQLEWSDAPANAEEAEYMNFVKRNVMILGVINAVLGVVISVLSFVGLRARSSGQDPEGDGRASASMRRWVLWLSAIVMFFLLAGWVMQLLPVGSALLALLLAIGLLLIYRPSASEFFR